MNDPSWSRRALKLSETRVWRTYTGGAGIDRWRGRFPGEVTSFPEDWVASVTQAINPGREEIPEGFSRVLNLPDQPLLKDVLAGDPEGFYGRAHLRAFGEKMGVLIKLIDAHERLTIQVHPDKQFAWEQLHSRYGKTEAWYILGTQEIDGQPPCIYYGFKPGITRQRWKEIFQAQDIPAMLDALHRIPVKAGDSFFIPGGLPHAIGAGCFLAEVQEPTDYTMRTELVTPGGLHIHENQCHQGVGYERMLDCFHYDGASLEETCRRWKVDPVDLHGDAGVQVRSYIDKRYTSLFSMKHVTVEQFWTVPRGGRLQIWIVLEGQGVLETEEERLPIRQGDFLLLPAAMPAATVRREGETVRLLACDPPIPEER